MISASTIASSRQKHAELNVRFVEDFHGTLGGWSEIVPSIVPLQAAVSAIPTAVPMVPSGIAPYRLPEKGGRN